MTGATYLDQILVAHRDAAADETRNLERLIDDARGAGGTRGFRSALSRDSVNGSVAVIAEVKRRSPSKGDLAPDLDPALLAAKYVDGGASGLSVLTDVDFFGGSVADLQAARTICELPVIRKDFTVCAEDVCDTRIMGADCVLLIAAALDDTELSDFHTLAIELGLDALVEIHDEAELERALAVDAVLIGVNQRDLVTFRVDTDRAVRMAPKMPDGVTRVAESGIGGPADAARLLAAGYHAVLVGESLVTSEDPTGAVAALRNTVD